MHPAFESAGKTAGLKIWRIEVKLILKYYHITIVKPMQYYIVMMKCKSVTFINNCIETFSFYKTRIVYLILYWFRYTIYMYPKL